MLLCVSCQAGPTLHPVRGAVLFKDKPVEGAMVVFHPADSNAPMPSGKTGANGSFSLLTPGHGEGAPAGDYIVLITLYPPTTEDGEELPKNQLPDRYADHAAGLLKATVRPGPNELEPFKLTVK